MKFEYYVPLILRKYNLSLPVVLYRVVCVRAQFQLASPGKFASGQLVRSKGKQLYPVRDGGLSKRK